LTANQKARIFNLHQQGVSALKIADTLGLSVNTVKSFCRRKQSPVCDISEKPSPVETKCKNCGQPLIQRPKQKRRRFCDDYCRLAWWGKHRDCLNRKALYPAVCAHCYKNFYSYGNKNRKYCCHAHYIAAKLSGMKEV